MVKIGLMPDFICDECGIILSSKQALDRHLSKDIKCSEKSLQCQDCKTKFKTKKTLKKHQKEICKGPPMNSLQNKLIEAETKLFEYERKLEELCKEPEADIDDDFINNLANEEDAEPKFIEPVKTKPPETIGEVNPSRSQVYFLRPGILLIPSVRSTGFPIKFGFSDNIWERIKQHIYDFGGAVVLDSIVTPFPKKVEDKLKRWLGMTGRIIECKSAKKKTKETEVICVKDFEDYEKIINRTKIFAKECEEEAEEMNTTKFQFNQFRKELEILKNQIR